MKKAYVVLPLVLLGFALAYFTLLRDQNKQSQPTLSDVQKSAKTSPTDVVTSDKALETLIIGDPSARVTIVEYADFKCPNCNKFHQQVGKQLRTDFIDRKLAKIEFRNIPFIASDSRPAAEGTYCANDQKKFVQYHDKVFEFMWTNYYRQDNSKEFDNILTVEKLTELAGEAGLDKTAFNQCLATAKHKSSVDSDLKKSEQDGVTGTPHIIINGKAVVGPQSYSAYKTLLEIALR